MHPTERAVQAGGAWLAIASFLMIATLVLHGPIAPELHHQMTRIADGAVRWAVAHWVAAAGLSAYAVSGLIVLTSRSRLVDGGWLLSAWAVICVACLWTITTAISEATVVTAAAQAGDDEMFAAWWRFAEGKANGFAMVGLPVAVIAGHEARSLARATPGWAASAAMVAGIVSFAGWACGMWFEIAIGSLVWVVASIAMCGWTMWFGVALTRAPGAESDRTTRAAMGVGRAASGIAPQ